VQLADYIRARIDDGTYSPRSRIPSEQIFTQETGFTRDPVRNPSQPLWRRADFTSCEDSARSSAMPEKSLRYGVTRLNLTHLGLS